MPELPEVETVVRSLRPRLVAVRVTALWTSGKALRLGRPVDVRTLRRLSVGARVERVGRRGKYVLVDVKTRDGKDAVWLIHLGMSGRLRVQAGTDPRVPHTHVVWTLDSGDELRFSDPRRFGLVRAARAATELVELRDLGPDPLDDLDLERLEAALRDSRAPIKSVLLDQSRMAGLGNIYVCEALFHASIHPATPARRVGKRAPALLEGIRRSLTVALANRGTTLRDFVDSDGNYGTNGDQLNVYGREGQPCPRCLTPVRRQVDAGRSTFFCARCQRR